MITKADTPPVEVELLQGKKIFNFDVKEVEIKDEMSDETRTGYEYTTVKVETNATRDEIIEAIIGSKYSVGAEIALTNDKDAKGDEYKAYQELRVLAKELAGK